MSTIRIAKRPRYTQVDRRTVGDSRLSWGARGLLVWLLDKPDDWRIDRDSLAAQGPDGATVIRRLLRELTTYGYLIRQRVRQEDHSIRTETVLYEVPPDFLENPRLVGFPPVGDPTGRKPASKTEDCGLKTEDSKTLARTDQFDAFWNTYPRHVAKSDAHKAWTKATRTADPAAIVAGAGRYADECRAHEREPRFIPYPASWLNAGRWDDEPTPVPAMPANGHRPSPVERGLANLARTARALEDQENGQPPSRQHSRPDAIDVDATRAD